jgi:hypothetical protein
MAQNLLQKSFNEISPWFQQKRGNRRIARCSLFQTWLKTRFSKKKKIWINLADEQKF